MSPFKFKFIIFILFGFVSLRPVHAETTRTLGVSYLSWKEKVTFSRGGLSDAGYSNFYGNGLVYSQSEFPSNTSSHGYLWEAALISGQASVGGSQVALPYHFVDLDWWGVQVSARYAYRISPMIVFSVGPLALNRNISLPQDSSGTEARSGAATNLGALGDVRLTLFEHWELHQSLGTLATRATTLWSMEISYKF